MCATPAWLLRLTSGLALHFDLKQALFVRLQTKYHYTGGIMWAPMILDNHMPPSLFSEANVVSLLG